MSTIVKLGSKGQDVKTLQGYLGITQDGDFGPKTDKAVREFQESHGLIVDGIVGPKTWALLEPPLVIAKKPLTKNISKRTKAIKYIVIHYTAGTSSAPGKAEKTRDSWQTGSRAASADFVVDDATIVQANPDIHKYYTWAVGDGNGKYGITNNNSVSIEICSNLTKGTSLEKPNHEGWYFTDAEIELVVKLVKKLMSDLGIGLDCIVRHYDASHKYCPGVLGWTPGDVYTIDGKKTSSKATEFKWKSFLESLL